VSVFWHYYFTR